MINSRNLLIILALHISLQAQGQADNLPKLLPKEIVSNTEEKETDNLTVLQNNNSQENWSFFSDTSSNKGISRFINALDLSGYFRTRFNYIRNGHLGTYVPSLGYGTSNIKPNAGLSENEDQNNYSFNMRLKLDPTINVSESIRVKSSINAFDNVILGSSPSSASLIDIKRLWGEINTPVGELRFGRLPFHWGLGILYNSGDNINSNYGDQVDGFLFSTRIFDHYLTPGYFISSGGASTINPSGQPTPIAPRHVTHTLSLSFLKRESDYSIAQKKFQGILIYNYGIFASYQKQNFDSKAYKDSNIGTSSFWQALSYKTFHIESEFLGVVGKEHNNKDSKILQGGAALESRYGFLRDQLQLGLNLGIASHQTSSSDYKTNFMFNKAYTIDMLMYKEVIGSVDSTVYIKPHLSYFFSKNLGLRGDVISSLAPNGTSSPSGKNFLGLELDASIFARSDSGLYFSTSYGVLFPFGLDHAKGNLSAADYKIYGKAKTAQAINSYLGITF